MSDGAGATAAAAKPTSKQETTAPRSPASTASKRSWFSRRPKTAPGDGKRSGGALFRSRARFLGAEGDARRDSGLASSADVGQKKEGQAGVEKAADGPQMLELPTIVVHEEQEAERAAEGGGEIAASRWEDDAGVPETPRSHGAGSETPEESASREQSEERQSHSRGSESFNRITTPIPTSSFDDLTSPTRLQFSNRGSVLLGGKRINKKEPDAANGANGAMSAHMEALRKVDERTVTLPRLRDVGTLSPPPGGPVLDGGRALSADEMLISRKVRSMYEHGDQRAGDWAGEDDGTSDPQDASSVDDSGSDTPPPVEMLSVDRNRTPSRAGRSSVSRSPSTRSHARDSFIVKEETELAGGIEDWDDVDGGDIDRYGFIVPRTAPSRSSNNSTLASGPTPQLRRVSTALKLASETPRRRRTLKKPSAGSSSQSTRSLTSALKRKNSHRSLRPAASMRSNRTTSTTTSTFSAPYHSLRHAANRLPHNRHRRYLDEASDMLTLPPGLADIAEQAASSSAGPDAAADARRREWARNDKWRRMARRVDRGPGGDAGGGMRFDFDTRDPKVASRAWKGIPDRWRATAWHAFLAASVRRHAAATGRGPAPDPADEDEARLVAAFHALQAEPSADDFQIDVDVPRTIGQHIMFRRRYRGGQRLLFRVLHALSLHVPGTGYVQGMAALAATLLCYFDEERAFVAMVWMWRYRGLEGLYQPGFGGLMEALAEFEGEWLKGGDVATKLDELGISSTAYGTRWYLTLFNYSIPFPAQLRVWDVFMLLGDPYLTRPLFTTLTTSANAGSNSASKPYDTTSTTTASTAPPPATASLAPPPPPDLDVLHATSAALIDATREILLDSDFENAMKVLTSWVPVRDEDLLMRVAKAEWKLRMRRRRASQPQAVGGGAAGGKRG